MGYVGDAPDGDQGPYSALLDPVRVGGLSSAPDDLIDLGDVAIEQTTPTGYLENRVSIQFRVPNFLVPGQYSVSVVNAAGELFGDLIGFDLFVGEPPDFPRSIEWPLDEPLIAELSGEARIVGPGFDVSVADLRAGNYPPNAADFMYSPESLPDPAVQVTAARHPQPHQH